jgi:hypothetical protein
MHRRSVLHMPRVAPTFDSTPSYSQDALDLPVRRAREHRTQAPRWSREAAERRVGRNPVKRNLDRQSTPAHAMKSKSQPEVPSRDGALSGLKTVRADKSLKKQAELQARFTG